MSTNADRIEVFTGIQRRRRYTAEQKMALVQEASQPGMTISSWYFPEPDLWLETPYERRWQRGDPGGR
jgi:hypothetical protein